MPEMEGGCPFVLFQEPFCPRKCQLSKNEGLRIQIKTNKLLENNDLQKS
jgi:hypothetical protein